MSVLSDRTKQVAEAMKEMKKEWVASEPEQTDLAMLVHLFRGTEPIAALQCRLDRDITLQACHLAVAGMAADQVVIGFESWTTSHMTNPATGKEWEHGQMSELGSDPEAVAKGWVKECLSVTGYDRKKNSTIVSIGYQITGTEVVFDEPVVMLSDDEEESWANAGGGYMQDAMLHAMSLPSVLEQAQTMEGPKFELMRDLMGTLGPEAVFFHIDCATLRTLGERELILGAVLLAEVGSERERMIEERFGVNLN